MRRSSSCRLRACYSPGAAGKHAPPQVPAAALGAVVELLAPAAQEPGLEVNRAQEGMVVLLALQIGVKTS